ncbi:MAG: bifunctional UDP-N-acetylglucosamine diphosphorylase/glucosamine-1-phosphate N-acetyltransferase GlmU, partial [Actinomycetota bacterium]|nr:bifunctional UDP-N-acetylglucosamine diphosphorylase/glucosamine-1-phosphate N-acetyltransferase GlmU [Actinomycetota bacterium]
MVRDLHRMVGYNLQRGKASMEREENKKLAVIILAAGKGKRMKSDSPKVLHEVCGKPIISYVLEETKSLNPGMVMVVVGHQGDQVSEYLTGQARTVNQGEPEGTGHAVKVALRAIEPEFSEVLVLPGDSPLIKRETLQELVNVRRKSGSGISMLVTSLPDPTGYGRVIRGQRGEVLKVVEEADAKGTERQVREINACMYVFERSCLEKCLEALTRENAQGEYYLTQAVEAAIGMGHGVVTVECALEEAMGINNRKQLAAAEEIMRQRINESLMERGVTLMDPKNTYVDSGILVGPDTTIFPFVFLSGKTAVGKGCSIGPGCVIKDSRIGESCRVVFSWLEECELGAGVEVGPFSRMRSGTKVADGCRVGSCVEIKKSTVGRGSKVPHLSYIGDTEIGEGTNVGAGTITCNYDGEKKHKTKIGDRVFIGSDT